MIKVAELREELGVSDADSVLIRVIRRATAVAKLRMNRYFFNQIYSISSDGATMTVVCPGHGLQTLDTVFLNGTNCFPVLDGEHQIRVTGPDTFTATTTVTTSIAGTDGVVHLKAAVELPGSGKELLWLPESFCPFLQVLSVAVRVGTDTWESLTAGDDWALSTDDQFARAVSIERYGNVWNRIYRKDYSRRSATPLPTVIVWSYQGVAHLPADVQEAVLSLCCELYENQGTSRDVASESYGGTSRARLSGQEKYDTLLSPTNIFENWRARV